MHAQCKLTIGMLWLCRRERDPVPATVRIVDADTHNGWPDQSVSVEGNRPTAQPLRVQIAPGPLHFLLDVSRRNRLTTAGCATWTLKVEHATWHTDNAIES